MVTDERLIAQMYDEANKMVRAYPRTRRGLVDFEDLVQDVMLRWVRGYDPDRGAPHHYLELCVRSVCLTEKRDQRLMLDDGEVPETGETPDRREEWAVLIAVLPYLRTSELRAIVVQLESGGWTAASDVCGVSKQALHKGIVGVQEVCRRYAEVGHSALVGVRVANMAPEAIALRARIQDALNAEMMTVA